MIRDCRTADLNVLSLEFPQDMSVLVSDASGGAVPFRGRWLDGLFFNAYPLLPRQHFRAYTGRRSKPTRFHRLYEGVTYPGQLLELRRLTDWSSCTAR